jgi:hypothetical protein
VAVLTSTGYRAPAGSVAVEGFALPVRDHDLAGNKVRGRASVRANFRANVRLRLRTGFLTRFGTSLSIRMVMDRISNLKG